MAHGHVLLGKYIELDEYKIGKTIIEIGSVREDLEGQNSTEYFIKLCIKYDMKLISVDIDPKCSQNVLDLCKKYNFINFTTITEKGEDYLKKIESFDYIYLDGYDYDHGKHAPERQTIYKETFKEEINNGSCWESHLEMVKLLNNKSTKDSIIGFDDIIDVGIGKGVTAVPFLLKNNWKIIEKNSQSAIFKMDSQ